MTDFFFAHCNMRCAIILLVALLIAFLLNTHDTHRLSTYTPYSKVLYTRQTQPPKPGHVRFFEHANFSGRSRDFPKGTVQNSLSKGLFGAFKENDTYSSAIVPPGLEVWAYEHNDLRGTYARIPPGRHPNLVAFNLNDSISSFKIVPEGSGSVPAAQFFEDSGFRGKALNFGGAGDWPSLHFGFGSRSRMISSAIIQPGYRAFIYTAPNFQGRAGQLLAGRWNMPQSFNDNIMSIKILKA